MLPHRLKEARKKKGISQQKLGVLAGIDESSSSARMNQYEQGTHTPNFDLMCRVADILDVPVCFFTPWKMSWPSESASGMMKAKNVKPTPPPPYNF